MNADGTRGIQPWNYSRSIPSHPYCRRKRMGPEWVQMHRHISSQMQWQFLIRKLRC